MEANETLTAALTTLDQFVAAAAAAVAIVEVIEHTPSALQDAIFRVAADADAGSGTCCHEQLMAGMGRTVLHPARVLGSTLPR
jgi:hypothetical protein